MERIEDNVIKNIENFMDLTNTRSANEMATRIGVPVTTWRSFLSNPLSNSIAKTKFCSYYGLNVKQLETTLFEDDFIKEVIEKVKLDENKKQEISINEMSEDDLQTMFEKNPSKSNEFEELKRKVKDKTSLSFRSNIENAKSRCATKPSEALALFNGAFALMKEAEVNLLTQSDLKVYIDLTIDDGNLNGLERLIDTLITEGYYNYKVVSVLALLLEEVDLIAQAKKCLRAILNR